MSITPDQAAEFNGWKNWQTWNVALWIQNDEPLSDLAKRSRSYMRFTALLIDCVGVDHPLTLGTPDGALWLDKDLDVAALDEMIGEL